MSVVRFIHDVFATPEDAERYDTEQPWICWRYLTYDARTRVTGRSVVLLDCCVCGAKRKVSIRIPRFGAVPIPASGRHPERARFQHDHLHPDRGHPITWAKPLRNLAVHQGGLDLDLLAMRLEADMRDSAPAEDGGPHRSETETSDAS